MASTNPFQHAENEPFGSFDAGPTGQATGKRRWRGASRAEKIERKKSRGILRRLRESVDEKGLADGFPAIEGLKPVLMFLLMPALVVLAIVITGGEWPKPILYGIALGLGLVVFISAFKGVELVLAVMLIYLPFSKIFVVPIAPGVNGTNMLVLLGLFAAILRAMDKRTKIADWPPGTWLVVSFGVISCFSIVTISLIPGGRTYFLYNEILSYKAWVDQFIFYFILLTCIRDEEVAKRCIVYVMIGSILVVLFAVPEMLQKMGRSTIDKSRIGGPHLQSNNFGGFVAYTLLPLVAMFVVYIKDLRAWLLTPYFLLAAKVLITTFSRGAYLAMAVGGLMAGYLKGKGFLAFWLSLAFVFFLLFPSFIPDSIMTRMETVTNNETSAAATAEQKLDKSSSTRLTLWRAAAVMIQEDPIFGKGFKGFPYLKEEYTETPVVESDPHSMYLYIGSQMGLPALSLYLLILGYMFYLGRYHARNQTDKFIKAIGIGGASVAACYAVVGVFGSRQVSLNFTAYFWTILVVMQVLKQRDDLLNGSIIRKSRARNSTARKARTNAFAHQRSAYHSDTDSVQDDVASQGTDVPPATRKRAGRVTNKRPKRGAFAHQAQRQSADEVEAGRSANTSGDNDEDFLFSKPRRQRKKSVSQLFGQRPARS